MRSPGGPVSLVRRVTHPMHQLTWSQVLARRLARHGLDAPDASVLVADAARRMCGAHAQIMVAAELSIGVRTVGTRRQDVQHAVWTERSLVKTFGPRGTVHLLPASELPWWTSALAAVPDRTDGLPVEQRLTPEQTGLVIAAMDEALRDEDLTTDELGVTIIARCGSWAGDRVIPAFQGMWPRWRRALVPAAHQGVVCFGPDRGRNVTWTSPRRWVGFDGPAAREVGLRTLVRRYLSSYGPVTPAELARWLGAPARWAQGILAAMASELAEVSVDGRPGWLAADDVEVPAEPPGGVQLLPYFDAYTVGSHPRTLVYPGIASDRALARGQAGNVPVLLLDGIVAGVWHQRRAGRVAHLTVEPFAALDTAALAAIEVAAARIGAIQGLETHLAIGRVEAGRHL